MQLKTKLLIAFGISVALTLGLFWMLQGRRKPVPGLEGPGTTSARDDGARGRKEQPALAGPAADTAEKKAPTEARSGEGRHASFAPDEVWLVVGRIVRLDEQGDLVPVEGARVLMSAHPRKTRPEEAPAPQERTTGPDGVFELAGCPGRVWMRLDIDEPSSAFRAFSFQLGEPDASGRRDLGDIPLEPALKLEIELVGPRGEAVEKGRVLVGRERSVDDLVLASHGVRDSRREATELGAGKYVLERTGAGPHSARILAPGYAGERQSFEMPHAGPVVIKLDEGRKLSGKVVDAEGRPIEGAVVELDSGPNLLEPDPTVVVDSAGAFAFDFLSEGAYEVSARAEGYARARQKGIAAGTEGLEVVLEKGALVSGVVLAAETGAPVEGARVTLKSPLGDDVEARSGPGGQFTLREVAGGTHTLSASHRDFGRVVEPAREIKVGETISDLVLKLPAGLAISGQVVDAATGAPIPEAQVVLDLRSSDPDADDADQDSANVSAAPGFRRSGKTDAGGAFRIAGVGEGLYMAGARARGYLDTAAEKLRVTRDSKLEVTLKLTLGGSISGRTLDPEGRPISGATVRPAPRITDWREMQGNANLGQVANLSTLSAEDGKYTLVGLPPHPDYTVRATHPSFPETTAKGIEVVASTERADVDLKFASGGSLRGRVLDAAGSPIAGASVVAQVARKGSPPEDRARDLGLMVRPTPDRSVNTDAEGKFSLEALQPGDYRLVARTQGKRSATLEGVTVRAREILEGLELKLVDGESIAGVVLDAGGAPVQGASVNVNGAESATARTDADGLFEVKGLARGEAMVEVVRQGFVTTRQQQVVPARGLRLKLERTAHLVGVVRDENGEAPKQYQVGASKLENTPDNPNQRGGMQAYSSRRDDQGSFDVEVPAGTYVLHASSPKCLPGKSAPVTVAAGGRVDGIVIQLTRGQRLAGVVLAAASGTPVQGAQVFCSVAADTENPQEVFPFGPPNATSDAEGQFVLEGAPLGAILLTVQHKDFVAGAPQQITVPRGGLANLKLELQSGGGIHGIVIKAGVPAAGAQVLAFPTQPGGRNVRNANTNGDGRFELDHLEAGEYRLEARGQGPATFMIRGTATVLDGQVTEVELRQEAGIRVQGRVTSGGTPIQGGRIEVMSGQGQGQGGKIQNDGSYSFEVERPGDYTLLLNVPGLTRGAVRLDLVVPPGLAEVLQDLEVPSGAIGGVVVDGVTGTPLQNAQVFAMGGGPGSRSMLAIFAGLRAMSSTDEQGRFLITGLAPGVYLLRAGAEGYAEHRVEVRVGPNGKAQDQTLPLDRGIQFRARVLDPGGRPVQGAMVIVRGEGGEVVQLSRMQPTDPEGVVSLAGLRPAVYQITAVHASFAAATSLVEVGDGGEAQLQLQAGARLQVSVVDRRGRPIEGATVEAYSQGGVDVLGDALFFRRMMRQGEAETHADGGLLLEQVPPGKYQVVARRGEAASREERVVIEAGKVAEVRLTLEE